ncbi:MAG: lysozyme inhibitor LprI family protein [Marinifilaceae bacterium]|jgi:uncharacterized protein YecT (DUF1311 family)|nr:lysozyme inhibitor LprI family protein [Marinifilaceae bacterium]
MKKNYILILFTLISSYSYSQIINRNSTLYHLQGVWEIIEDSDKNSYYKIYKGYRSLKINFFRGDFFIDNYTIGYLDEGRNQYKDLKDHGKFNEFINMGVLDKETGKIIDTATTNLVFEGSEEEYYDTYTTGTNFDVYFHRVKKAYNLVLFPPVIWQGLLTKEEKDKENYIFDFLDLDIRKIIIPEAKLYNEKREELNKTLPKNEIVEILAIGEAWVKVNYYTDDKNKESAYIKYSSISPKAPIPSFDPAKAKTKIEKAICSDVVLASLDFRMHKVYKKLKKNNTPDLKTTQTKWLKTRNKSCENKSGEELIQSLKKLYKLRLMELGE